MFDPSSVTDSLSAVLTQAISESQTFGGDSPPVSARHPREPRASDTELNVFLFRLGWDMHTSNGPVSRDSTPGPTLPSARLPFAANLWYLISAQSKTSSVREQQLLGVVMQCLYDNPRIQLSAETSDHPRVEPRHASVTPELLGVDELSAIWRALQAPLRAATVYRVSTNVED
ncbi:Pvc16 family protein [Nesterenkonia sp. Act20]|uniref:Pvc16 family protein n=1 Tax=Nesterenkonia sp. Act20 TaxID=1483432 RepID=UPI001C45F774|nr:Pvc16 family protein [Nesterenkonia sp. Act20]